MDRIQRFVRIRWVVGRWKSDKQPRDVRGRCINSFKGLFCIPQNEAIFLPGQLIHC